MANTACVFCDASVGGRREHVLATWFLGRYDDQGPFTIMINGQPVPQRSGRIERDQLSRVMLPVCDGSSPIDCNGWLNTTFEQPAKPYVRAALDELQPIAGGGVKALARWAAKILLLYRHPDAVNSELPDRARGVVGAKG